MDGFPTLGHSPLRFKRILAVLYVGLLIFLGVGGVPKVAAVAFAAVFSFQFWVYASWNGFRSLMADKTPEDGT